MKAGMFVVGVVLSPLIWGIGKLAIFLIGLATVAWIATLAVDIWEEEKRNAS